MGWALVAGASEGLGAAFAEGLHARGHSLVLLARRQAALDAVAGQLKGREVVTAAVDLGADGVAAKVAPLLEGREVDVLVYNAAAAPVGPFLKMTPEQTRASLDVNCRAPVELLHLVLPGMVARGRGAVVLMSSLSAYQGVANTAVYGATKAFNLNLAEALWAELRGTGVEVLACCSGAIRTKSYLESMPGGAPGELEPAQVVREALDAIGKGPAMIPGRFNRFAAFMLRRLMPRRAAILTMASQTKKLHA
ncbi:MAG: SDR family NAD(P)-dependent oxidoreductase [Myxococcaceae bacterium]|nr:SDR family NAD(P)-dependent oxidoreductase [Myxococcaceae bacterium]